MWIQAAMIVGAVIAGNIVFLLMLGHRTPAKWAAAAFQKIKEEASKIQARRDMWRAKAVLGFFLVLAAASSAHAQYYASSENFVICDRTQILAEQTLELAEQMRDEIAQEWLGDNLVHGQGPAIVHVVNKPGRSIVWPIDSPKRKHHLVWLHRNVMLPLDDIDTDFRETLRHEITHVVLETAHPGFPRWAHEGIASLIDESDYAQERRTIQWMLRTRTKTQLVEELSHAH